MITYDRNKNQIVIGEWLTWDNTIKPVYEEHAEWYREDAETVEPPKLAPPTADELTMDQVEEIMELVAQQLDYNEIQSESFDIDDSIRAGIDEWLEGWVDEHDC